MRYRIFKFLLVILTLRQIYQEICVLWVLADTIVVILQSFFEVSKRVIAHPKPIWDTCVLLHFLVVFHLNVLLLLRNFEILNSFLVPFGVVLRSSSPKESLRAVFVILDGCSEVLDCQLVVFHVLVYHTSGDVHGLVVLDFC